MITIDMMIGVFRLCLTQDGLVLAAITVFLAGDDPTCALILLERLTAASEHVAFIGAWDNGKMLLPLVSLFARPGQTRAVKEHVSTVLAALADDEPTGARLIAVPTGTDVDFVQLLCEHLQEERPPSGALLLRNISACVCGLSANESLVATLFSTYASLLLFLSLSLSLSLFVLPTLSWC
jgi:hypothetical protein